MTPEIHLHSGFRRSYLLQPPHLLLRFQWCYLLVYILCLFQQHYQNFQLLGAWCLLNSLFLILNLSPTALADKGKEKDPLAALRVRDILSRTKEGVGSPKLGPGKGYVSI